MFTDHPFLAVSDVLPPRFMQVYVVLMAIAVVVGTLADVYHKRSGEFFADDHPRLVDDDWHVFTSLRYDAKSRAWQMEKLPVHHIVS